MHEQASSRPDAAAPSRGDDGMIGVLTALGEAKKGVALVVALALAAGLAAAFLLPARYTARTVLLAQQHTQLAGSGVAGTLGVLAASAGVASAFKSPEELYVGLLQTDSVADALIRRFRLQDRYDEASLAGTRRALARATRLGSDRRSSLITLEVEDRDAGFAAQLANGYVDELQKLLTRIAVTEAQQRRLYFERQMDKAKIELAKAELSAKRAQERHGLISLDAQTQTAIGAAAQLRAQIVAREVQLQAMRPYAGPDNPELKRLLAEIGGLRTQLLKLEGGVDRAVPVGADPADALANVRVFRELKYQEAMYASMAQQLQLAKAEEAMDAPLVQQVDAALPPDRRSWPARTWIMVGAGVIGLLLGTLYALGRRMMQEARLDPWRARRLQALAAAWKGHAP
jgi:uncharacterized protein involved in exopolysaccharide biosynthesis